MEANVSLCQLNPSQISERKDYGWRFDYRDPALEASIRHQGVLFPLWIAHRDNLMLVAAGHKRLAALKQVSGEKISVVMIEESMTSKEVFLLSILSNWNQKFSELDRMTALRKGRDELGFSKEELVSGFLPALGLEPKTEEAEVYFRVAALASEIHPLIFEGKIPFRGAWVLDRFSREDQKFLAVALLSKIHLTFNQMMLMGEWLHDLQRKRGGPLSEVLSTAGVSVVTEHPGMDLRTKGERVVEAIRRIRFPRVLESEQAFKKALNRLEAFEEIRLERSGGQESDGLTLRARLRSRVEIQKVLEFLEKNRETLGNLVEKQD